MKNIITKLAVFVLLLTTTSLYAAVDYFLEIEGIKGESKGKIYKGAIDKNGIVKMSKVLPGEYNIKMCASGEHIKSAKLFVRKQGTEQHDYMKGGTVDISSFSFGATQMGNASTKGKVNVATGDVNGDGRADIITSKSPGAGNATNAMILPYIEADNIKMMSVDGKMASASGGGAGKVSMQDFHFTMKPVPARGKDMFEGQVGTVKLIGPPDNKQGIDSFFDVFIDID